MSNEYQKRLILPGSNKGGVGKSYFNVNLVEWLRRHPQQPKIKAFDPDAANRTLTRFHDGFTEFIDVERDSAMDVCFNAFEEVDTVVVDGVGSRQRSIFQKWITETQLFETAEDMGIGVTYSLLIEDDTDVLEQTLDLIQQAGDYPDWVACLNEKTSRYFPVWERSKAKKALEKAGGEVIRFQKLNDNLRTFINKYGIPPAAASEESQVGILDQRRFKNLAMDMDEQFQSVAHFLLPSQYLEKA